MASTSRVLLHGRRLSMEGGAAKTQHAVCIQSTTQAPGTSKQTEFLAGEEINLEGWDCYDAAVHCASICAGQRATKALNVASPDVMHPRSHVVLGPGVPTSQEPFQATEAEEGQGCWRLLKATVSSMWCAVLCTLVWTPCGDRCM